MANDREYRTLSADEAKAILEAGRFDDFKGIVEGTLLDFKREPYLLSGATPVVHEKAKRDLVEDIVRFANVEGGIIVLGVETEQVEAQRTEVGKAIHPFPESRIDAGQYRDVIFERTRPHPQGLTVRWFPGPGGGTGLGAVIVPSQPSQLRKTFFATRTFVDETTGKTLGAYVGYLERSGAEGVPMSAEELYQTFQAGRRFSELRERFESLAERVDELTELVRRLVEERAAPPSPLSPEPPRPRPAGPDVTDACSRRGEAVRDAGLNDRPTFSLIALPGEAVEVPELFAGSRSELVRLLENPPELRPSGFDLTVGERPVVVPPGIRRALIPGHRLLQLMRDGVLIFVADAQGLLCWGTSTNEQPLRLNVLALAETTYLFADLVHRLSAHLTPPPDTWRYVIGLQRMELDGKHAVLAPGSRRSAGQLFPLRQRALPNRDFEFGLTAIPATSDPRVVAYRVRRELYAAFGFDEDAIPYVVDVNGERGTDPEQIKEDGKGP